MNGPNPADPLIRALSRPASYDEDAGSIEIVETHISWVFLTKSYAYKIKKPLRLPFLDFTTLELRRHFCEEELRLNRRLAPELYLAIVPIGGSREAPRVGQEPAIEYAVKMRRFAADARLDRRLGRITGTAVEALAERIAEFHERLPSCDPASGFGAPAAVAQTALDNLAELRNALGQQGEARLARLDEWTELQCRELESGMRVRQTRGLIREAHGDLHLENLAEIGGEIVPFDALEFDPALRWIDVMNEAAFLAMDLMAHGRSDFAFRFLNRYLEVTGDYAGLRVLRFYLVYRALVRAKVRAIKAAQGSIPQSSNGIEPYLSLAAASTVDAPPLLLITHGFSGSGKTSVTNELTTRLPAVRVRSDLERKRLHGLRAEQRSDSRLGNGIYDQPASERTYRRLEECASHGLAAGVNMIVDATFLRRAERRAFRALAERQNARFVVLDCVATPSALKERIRARWERQHDASEATLEVLDEQQRRHEALCADEALHTLQIDTLSRPDYDLVARRLHTLAGTRAV